MVDLMDDERFVRPWMLGVWGMKGRALPFEHEYRERGSLSKGFGVKDWGG